MQRPVSAKVTRERWQPPPESSFIVTFTSALSGATPKQAHRVQQSGPGGAAFVTPLLPLTPCNATACPAAFAGPRPVIWLKLGIVWCLLLPYCLCLRRRPEGGGRERGAAQASKQACKQATDVVGKVRGEHGRLLHPRRAPIIFLLLSDAGLSGWKGILLAALALIHSKDRPITFGTVYICGNGNLDPI